MTTSFPLSIPAGKRYQALPLLQQIVLMTERSLRTQLRTPEAVLPNLFTGVFFLIIFNSALGGTASFVPDLQGVAYVAFVLPLSIISGALNAPAGQAMVRDLESGYFDKLLLTPISRTALLLGHIIASGVIVVAQSAAIIAVAMLLGLESASGAVGIIVTLGFALFIGLGFGGFTVGVALRTGNAGATQGASFIFFPLSFLTTAFFPLEYLDGWLKIVATINPITYILDTLRTLFISGWDNGVMLNGSLAALLMSGLPFLFAIVSLRVRTRRK